MKKFIVLLEEETRSKKTPLELTNNSNVITFIISIINDIFVYNMSGDKYTNILTVLMRNLPKHSSLLFIDTLDYLSKDSEKLHIILFLEFAKKTIDLFFEKLQQNRVIMAYFAQEKNVYFTEYLQFCIDLFRSFKNINFIVKSAVLDKFNLFLQSETRNSNRYGVSERNIKRSSTPDMILGMLDTKYQWKINTKNLSISPTRLDDGHRRFFANNHYHKKKNSSFETKVKNRPKNISTTDTSTHQKEAFQSKVSKIHQQLMKHKSLLTNLKQTNDLFKKINESITQEIKNLHSTIKSQILETEIITDAGKQSQKDLEKSLRNPMNLSEKSHSRPKSDIVRIQLNPSFESLSQINMSDSVENHHYKKTSRTNKLSFGQKSLSHEKFDSFHNLNAVSPKFEGTETNKSFSALHTVSEFNAGARRTTMKNDMESDNSCFEENKAIIKNCQILFKERFEGICNKSYKDKPIAKKHVRIVNFILFYFKGSWKINSIYVTVAMKPFPNP